MATVTEGRAARPPIVGGGARPIKPAERYLPIILAVVALVAAVVVLPTALRPPPDQANQTAQFSPDAPPDEQSESIVAALGRASSGTSTTEDVAVDGSPPAAVDAALTPGEVAAPEMEDLPPQVKGARRGRCFGNPPRQTDSLYSAPCAPAFVGDNGGATYRGVSGDKIKVAIEVCSGTLQTSYSGPVPDQAPPGETTRDRTYRIYQQYFNKNFEFYGRKLQFYSIVPDDNTNGGVCDETEFRNAFAAADEKDGPFFGLISENSGAVDEAIRRKIAVGGSYGNTLEWYDERKPFAHSWAIDGTKIGQFAHEFICKQMWNKPVSFTDAADFVGKPRKYGLILYRSTTHTASVEDVQAEFKRQCGGKWDNTIVLNIYDPNQRNSLANAMLQFKADGVSTVSCFCDWLSVALLTAQATSASYFPEWIMPGTGEEDRNELAALYDDQQWKHAVGIKFLELARPDEETDWWRAYKSMSPDTSLDTGVGRYVFPSLLQYANGVQQAGPKITPGTLLDGLGKMPKRPPQPDWAVAGGYGPGDPTYTDYASMVWWRNEERRPEPDDGTLGAYCHVYGGKRYALGEIPTEPAPFFKDCTSRAPIETQGDAPSG